MKMTTLYPSDSYAEPVLLDSWFDAIEDGVRGRVRSIIETILEEELASALSRQRYERVPGDSDNAVAGHRHGHRTRTLTGTFGPAEIAVPRARLRDGAGKTKEWKSQVLRAYQRRTAAADALIAVAYLAGTNTRRVRRALQAVFAGSVSQARASIDRYLDFYNHERPHSALDERTPDEAYYGIQALARAA